MSTTTDWETSPALTAELAPAGNGGNGGDAQTTGTENVARAPAERAARRTPTVSETSPLVAAKRAAKQRVWPCDGGHGGGDSGAAVGRGGDGGAGGTATNGTGDALGGNAGNARELRKYVLTGQPLRPTSTSISTSCHQPAGDTADIASARGSRPKTCIAADLPFTT